MVDTSQTITIENFRSDGTTYYSEYYKVIGLPACTESELNERLESLVTENLKTEEFNSLIGDLYKIKDGSLYINSRGCAYGGIQGVDRIYLDSIEYSDEKTVMVNMTAFGDKNKWEMEKDIENKFTVKIIKTNDGLRIEECNPMAVAYIHRLNEILYGDISFSF